MRASPRRPKLRVTALLFIIFGSQVFGLALARPASAQLATQTVGDLPRVVSDVQEFLEDTLGVSAVSALIHAVAYFSRKLAYDTAVLITSGATGQKSLIQEKGFSQYVFDELGNSAADAIGELGKEAGLNLCRFPDLNFRVFFQIGLRDLYGVGPPQPTCDWQGLKDGWDPNKFAAQYGGDLGQYIGEKFNASLSVKNSDFGIAMGAIAKIDALQVAIKDAKIAERLEGGGLKPVTDLISGQVKTPAELVKEDLKQISVKEQKNLTEDQLASIYNNAQLRLIVPTAASVFLNTIASQLLNKLLSPSQGLLPSGTRGGFDPSEFGIGAQANRRAAQQAFIDLLRPNIPELGSHDILSEFATCPQNPGLNHCVINKEFQVAVERARTAPITIREAIAEGLLNGGWRIISPRDEVKNTSKECFRSAYCYSNIQKLRKARILPLGFEIAALKADPANPPTLQEVIDGFESCAPDGRPNPQYPWCHLINPNWVLKSPEIFSQRLIGPELIDARTPERREEFMDFATCVLTDENGKCQGNYGYCTVEKNVWRLGGDTCEPQYNTCKTYVNEDGGQISYLSRTLEYGECTADVAGCRAYSTHKVNDVWASSAALDLPLKQEFGFVAGNNYILHFNGSAEGKTCSAGAEGCTAFYLGVEEDDGSYTRVETMVHAKKAPDYFGCYDTNFGESDPIIDWPTTVAQIESDIVPNSACDAFASVCVASEVGCDAFTAVRDPASPAIPGIVGGGACVAECVGYDTFREDGYDTLGVGFEPSRFPVHFIPENGLACDPVYAGCDEFTNLDEVAQGGEGLEYYTKIKYCEKPDGTNERVYYSWEGSASEGFVLRVHRLLQVDEAANAYLDSLGLALGSESADDVFPIGSPAYDDASVAALNEYYAACNAENYAVGISDPLADVDLLPNPDCKALYDEVGNVYYRWFEHTVTVAEDCHPLRKSNAVLYADANTSEDFCDDVGGLWENNACQRCYQGGRYVNGACVYQTISRPGEGSSCPAAQNGCRAYVGNTGNNREVVFEDVFEPSGDDLNAARDGWEGEGATQVRVASEALQVSGHSLLIDTVNTTGNAYRIIAGEGIRSDFFYELSFWARSNSPQNVRIYFEQDTAGIIGEFTIDAVSGSQSEETVNSAWTEYRLGPVAVSTAFDPAEEVRLTFAKTAPGASSPYFLDYVRLIALQDTVYLVKDSWKTPEGYDVPLACDANPTDAFPGAALGCTEYTNSAGGTVYAAAFESLCREKAVGCRPLYDTKNTLEGPGADLLQAYNLWCTAATDAATTCTIDVDGDAGEEPPHTCSIRLGDDGCYIEEKVVFPESITPTDAMIRASTILLPADTPDDEPIFLAIRDEFLCQEEERGCMKLGLEEHVSPGDASENFRHIDTYLLNDPDEYRDAQGEGILCREEVAGCSAYESDNAVSYFRDPTITGGGVCSYRSNVRLNENDPVAYSGWFLDGADPITPCYNTFLRRTEAGLIYDLYSNSDPQYAGRVGACPVEANTCTEFLDPADTSDLHPDGKPYYVLFNENVRDRIGACEGRVSLTEGCVLLDQTENPNKLYSTALTYSRSEGATPPFSLVSPVSESNPAANDANIILKVDRDRECSEWLACQSSIQERDAQGELRTLCTEYSACDATIPGQSCTHWIPRGSAPFARLTESAYIRRDTSWQGVEYSGYSLFNKYQIHDQTYIRFDLAEYSGLIDRSLQETMYLVHLVDSAQSECQIPETSPGLNTNWQACGPGENGRCYGQRCLVPIEATIPAPPEIPSPVISDTRTLEEQAYDVQTILGYFTGGSCKAFPEKASPFPGIGARNDVLEMGATDGLLTTDGTIDTESETRRREFSAKKQPFSQANVCQQGECSCAYTKFIYKGGTTDFWPTDLTQFSYSPPAGVCGSGTQEGRPCTSDSQCGAGGSTGVCNLLAKRETHIGLSGFCLEPDISRPINGRANFAQGENQTYACLTWLPIEVSASTVDFYNTYVGAGYYPELDARVEDANSNPFVAGRAYCAVGTRVGGRVYGLSGTAPTQADADADIDEAFSTQDPASAQGYFLEGVATGDDAFPRLPGNYSCEDASGNNNTNYPYIDFACDPDFNSFGPDSHYRLMQSWAWEAIGDHALVLRVETDTGRQDTRGGREFWGGFLDPASPVCSNCPNLHHVVPTPSMMGVGRLGFGTVMHPPRIWDDGVQSNNLANESFYEQQVSPAQTARISGIGLSAEPRGLFSRYTQRSVAEPVINERDIGRLYFVPTSFPYDAEGVNPLLLSRQLAIDFRDLNSSADRANIASVRAFFENDDGPGLDYFLPDYRSYQSMSAGDNEQAVTAWLWTYKQTLNPHGPDSSVAFSDYSHMSGPGTTYYTSAQGGNAEHARRNGIASRYVAVFVNNFHEGSEGEDGVGQFPNFIPLDFPNPANGPGPAVSGSDPFHPNATCVYQEDGPTTNWFAIGLDFNEDGEFLGYISRWCYGTGTGQQDEQHGMTFAVVAELNDQCTEFAEVYEDSNLLGTSNKAWTNRVWQFARDGSGPLPHPTVSGIRRDSANQPFASLSVRGDDLRAENARQLRQSTFAYQTPNGTQGFPFADGIPYSCSDAQWLGLPIISSSNICGANTPIDNRNRTRADAYDAIHELFAQVFGTADQTGGLEDLAYVVGQGEDRSEQVGSDLLPPQIYSVNPSQPRCFGDTSDTRPCSAGESGNMTVNGRNYTTANYDGRAPTVDEDANQDGFVDPIIGVGQLNVVLQFFGFADDNRMPIRRVTVDWGDGRPADVREGLFQNHKPFCSTDEGERVTVGLCGADADSLTPLTCMANGHCPIGETCFGMPSTPNAPAYQYARFGNAPRACTTDRFQSTYGYTCDLGQARSVDLDPTVSGTQSPVMRVADVQNLPDDKGRDAYQRLTVAYGLSDTDEVCIYQPRVQLKDNWGWCNGDIAGGYWNLECEDYAAYTPYNGYIIVVPE